MQVISPVVCLVEYVKCGEYLRHFAACQLVERLRFVAHTPTKLSVNAGAVLLCGIMGVKTSGAAQLHDIICLSY